MPSSSFSVATPSPPSSHSHFCNHSPSATIDLHILLLVLFAGAFLLSSYFSYIFNYLIPFLLFSFTAFSCCGSRSRKYQRRDCRGLKKAMEFDSQIQTEDTGDIG